MEFVSPMKKLNVFQHDGNISHDSASSIPFSSSALPDKVSRSISDEGIVADHQCISSVDSHDNKPSFHDPSSKNDDVDCNRSQPDSSDSDDEVDMLNVQNRINSFRTWPLSFLSPHSLAGAGFYYTGVADRVRCVNCGGVLTSWHPGDNPVVEHAKHFPHCLPNNMVALHRNGSSRRRSSVPRVFDLGEDVCGIHATFKREPSALVLPVPGPKRLDMADYKVRFSTFANWPEDKTQQPRDLAQAGLFYTGDGDQVMCFHCGQMLERWDPQDDPFTEHARWYPQCEYLIRKKGQEFIDDVLERFSSSQSTSSGFEDHSSSSSSDTYGSDDYDTEESLVYEALRRNCDQETVLQALREKRAELSFARFRDIDELVEAVHKIENQKMVRKALLEKAKEDAKASSGSQILLSEDDLKKENERLRSERRCKVCLDKDTEMIFQPCGHVACCKRCSQALTSCPICRKHIFSRNQIYFA